jgi:Flp pilus assembly secretin CpaC
VRVSAATALAIQSAIAQTMNGAASARVRAAGSEVILSGTVPNAPAAQQAEAIARAYVGEKAVWSTHCWCLAAFRSMSGSV